MLANMKFIHIMYAFVFLVSEYLHMLEDRKYMPKGAVTFAQLTPNAIHESAVSG